MFQNFLSKSLKSNPSFFAAIDGDGTVTASLIIGLAAPCPCPAGTREGVRFLKEHGIPLPVAQRVAERCGQQTVAWVQSDPYAAMAGSGLPFRCGFWCHILRRAPKGGVVGAACSEGGHVPSVHARRAWRCPLCYVAWAPTRAALPAAPPACSKVDQLAAKVGAPADLVSRAATAMQQCLGAAAAEEGHTFLPWHRLEKDCGRLLEETGRHHGTPWEHAAALHLVAQHMHACGKLVAEPAGPSLAVEEVEAAAMGVGENSEQAVAAELGTAALAAAGVPQPGPAAAPARVHPDFGGDLAALRDYLGRRLKGASRKQHGPASELSSSTARGARPAACASRQQPEPHLPSQHPPFWPS